MEFLVVGICCGFQVVNIPQIDLALAAAHQKANGLAQLLVPLKHLERPLETPASPTAASTPRSLGVHRRLLRRAFRLRNRLDLLRDRRRPLALFRRGPSGCDRPGPSSHPYSVSTIRRDSLSGVGLLRPAFDEPRRLRGRQAGLLGFPSLAQEVLAPWPRTPRRNNPESSRRAQRFLRVA